MEAVSDDSHAIEILVFEKTRIKFREKKNCQFSNKLYAQYATNVRCHQLERLSGFYIDV